MDKRILFITHETSRTGAPIMLLHFMQWLQKHKLELSVDVLAVRGGDLEGDFKECCLNYYNYREEIRPKPQTFFKKVLKKLKLVRPVNLEEQLMIKLSERQYDLLYANTVLALPLGNKVKKYLSTSKLILHVHELPSVISLITPNFKELSQRLNHFIAASKLVQQNLIDKYAVPVEKITQVYECSEVHSVEIRKRQSEVLNVGGSGFVHWRKGSDLFIQVAYYLKKERPDLKFHFTWVGDISREQKIIHLEDIKKSGLSENVTFIGKQANPTEIFNDFDLFLMTSREDPFPLVCIEVGLLGKPILTFKGATGTEEFLEEKNGDVVPYLDTKAMALQILRYVDNPNLFEEVGERNKGSFTQFTPDNICPKLFDVLASC